MNDVEDDFFRQLEAEEEKEIQEQTRKNFFKTIGAKGGKKKKSTAVYDRIVTVRFSRKEVENIQAKSKKFGISLSQYIRLVATGCELKINEHLLDGQLIYFGNSFKRISNIIRNSSFAEMEKRQQLLDENEQLVREIRDYLYTRLINKHEQ